MKFFWDTPETVADGVGFSHFDVTHLGWLAVFAIIAVLGSVGYGKLSCAGRRGLRKGVAAAMLIMEALKLVFLLVSERFMWDYLPLHLCGINIFLIAVHAWKPSKLLDNFLYLVCIPGALAALLFPNWTALPLGNAFHIHSFIVHILLVLYPLMLALNGQLSLDIKEVPKTLGILAAMAIPIYGLNLLLNTNFMFLMWASVGNPLYWFGQKWGSHLFGFPVIIAAVVLVMYLPVVLLKKRKN